MAKKAAQYTMKSLEQVRILAHPLRLRLLENFAQSAQTTRQVAEKLGVPATRLYHHVNALEAVGLIRLKETRPVRGTIEKYYEAVAKKMIVGAGVFGEARGELSEVLANVLDEARRDLEAALEREDVENLRPLALRAIVHGTPAQVAALRKKLHGLLKEMREKKGTGAKAWITLVCGRGRAQALETPGALPEKEAPYASVPGCKFRDEGERRRALCPHTSGGGPWRETEPARRFPCGPRTFRDRGVPRLRHDVEQADMKRRFCARPPSEPLSAIALR